jgi:hypothetical protein
MLIMLAGAQSATGPQNLAKRGGMMRGRECVAARHRGSWGWLEAIAMALVGHRVSRPTGQHAGRALSLPSTAVAPVTRGSERAVRASSLTQR